MKTRNLGSLSAPQIVRIATGMAIACDACKLDREERLRFDALQASLLPLEAETDARIVDDEPEAIVGAIDAVVDMKWGVVRDVFECGARLEGEPMGEECKKLLKKFFPDGITFTKQDSQLQLAHGVSLLAKLQAEDMSPSLKGFVGPILVGLKKNQAEYKVALDAKLLQVKLAPQLQIAREDAIEALEDFVSYIDVMAKKDTLRAKRILAPLETMLDSNRRPTPRKKDDGDPTDAPTV